MLNVLNNEMSIVFYDVTTLYLLSGQEDELRKTGLSKDGKRQHPIIVLGLLVITGAYPRACKMFEGNKCDAHSAQKRQSKSPTQSINYLINKSLNYFALQALHL